MNKRLKLGIAACFAGALALTACSPAASDGAKPDDTIEVGFFGFSTANSFAQAVFTGVKQGAEGLGAKATFVDGQFNGQLQAQQVSDAVTSKRYDVIVIQANDNLVVQEPLRRAVEAGISVVIEFTPVGPDFNTVEPQVEGAISMVDLPAVNGEALADMAISACEEVDGECKVAYMEGAPSLPLDNTRTKAVVDTLKATGGDIVVLPNVVGGYSADEGRTAFQNIMQANPDVDVVIGSSQAIAGAATVAGAGTDIKFIANGTPQSAVQKVRSGEWFALYATDAVLNGKLAAEAGIKHAKGEKVPMAVEERNTAPGKGIGTKENLDEADFTSGYDE